MEILLILLVGTLNIVCFLVGAKVGQQVSKGEPIKAPEINPMKAARDRQDRRAAEEEKNKLDTILRNIEVYDGTANRQEDVPR